MPEADVIQPSHLLALSLLALGASTLHGVRSSSVVVPSLIPFVLRPLVLIGSAQAAAIASARERTDRACVAERGRDASGCSDR